MAKSLSILLSMLLLISAAQVEAKLQIISNNELKQHSEKRGAEKAPAQKAIADNSKQTTESYVSNKTLLTWFSVIGGVLAVAGHKIVLKTAKEIYDYLKGETTKQRDSEDRKDQGDNPSGNRQNGDQHEKPQNSPAASVSVGSSMSGVSPLSGGNAAMGDELGRGAKPVIAASLSSSSNSHTFVREEEDDDDDDASPSSSSSSSCNTVEIRIREELKRNASICSSEEYGDNIKRLIASAETIMKNKTPSQEELQRIDEIFSELELSYHAVSSAGQYCKESSLREKLYNLADTIDPFLTEILGFVA